MTALRSLAAELSKVASLPATLVALLVAALGPLGITVLNALYERDQPLGQAGGASSSLEVAFSAVPLGTVGAIIVGVACMSSEYTANSAEAGAGRQITTALAAVPRRLTLLVTKALAIALVIGAMAVVVAPASVGVARLILGDAAGPTDLGDVVRRCAGAGLYWVLMGVIALAITALTRSGMVPLVVLIVNSSLVSVSVLLSKVTSLARYLPDMAGIRLFMRDYGVDDPLEPLAGGLVMGAWAVGLLAVATVVFARRDA